MKNYFSERRSNLAHKVLDDSAIIIASASVKSRISDTDYAYRQDSNFYYLSGYEEPESLILIRPNHDNEKFIIFCRDRDPLREQWDGFRTGQEGAISEYGADASYSINSVDQLMPELLKGSKNIYFNMSSPCGKHAADITTEAHIRAMQAVTPGMFEYQLEAEYLYAFNKNGARSPAYNSIVGGGNNSCILHYVENNAELKDGDLVLVDAGCEYQYYASDVTRTFPVNGKFSPEQKEIYSIVLEAHKQSIEQAQPGKKWNLMHEKSVEVLVEGLLSLGLLNGSKEENIEKGLYSKFYMHRIGHWLGMDVHDVGAYKKDGDWRELEKGMVMTIEPGIYILDSLKDVDDKWKGIGVRIEDNIVINDSGNEFLTPDVPRTIEEVEQTVQG